MNNFLNLENVFIILEWTITTMRSIYAIHGRKSINYQITISVTKDEIRIKSTVNAKTLNADDGRRKYGQSSVEMLKINFLFRIPLNIYRNTAAAK